MRATGKDGFLYAVTFGEAITGNDNGQVKITKSGFYKIKSVGSATGLPRKNGAHKEAVDLSADMIFWGKNQLILKNGDVVIPLNLKKISFVTDTSDSSQTTSHDVTTQADIETGLRSYVAGAFKERTGSISGYVDTESEEQRELLKEYRMVSIADETNTSVYISQTKVHHFMLSRAEKVATGESEMWEYFPVITEQLQMDKPMDGVQPFSFNYRVDGSSKPMTMYVKKG